MFVPFYFSNDDHGAWKYQANALGKKHYSKNIAKYFNGKANFTKV